MTTITEYLAEQKRLGCSSLETYIKRRLSWLSKSKRTDCQEEPYLCQEEPYLLCPSGYCRGFSAFTRDRSDRWSRYLGAVALFAAV